MVCNACLNNEEGFWNVLKYGFCACSFWFVSVLVWIFLCPLFYLLPKLQAATLFWLSFRLEHACFKLDSSISGQLTLLLFLQYIQAVVSRGDLLFSKFLRKNQWKFKLNQQEWNIQPAFNDIISVRRKPHPNNQTIAIC